MDAATLRPNVLIVSVYATAAVLAAPWAGIDIGVDGLSVYVGGLIAVLTALLTEAGQPRWRPNVLFVAALGTGALLAGPWCGIDVTRSIWMTWMGGLGGAMTGLLTEEKTNAIS